MKMKRYAALLLTLLLLMGAALPAQAEEEYEIRALHMYAHAYAVMDANTGEILFGENVDKMIYPASTAKLMSAIVTVESGVDLDTVIELDGKIVEHTTVGTYDLNLRDGDYHSIRDLLNMSLIASAADATDMIANYLYGSRSGFAEKMMEKVEELGLTATSFDNPVGSDIGASFNETYSTAREMCEITRYAMSNPTIRSIVRKPSYVIEGTGSQSGREIKNTNRFYNTVPYNSEYFTIIGSKSGQTTAAGNVFIATAIDDEGHELICAYFGMDTREETFRWINNLLTYAFKNYQEGNLTLSKGAYNARYHAGSTAVARSMDAGIIEGNSDGTINLDETITEKQAVEMINASLSREADGTCVTCHFDELKGKDNVCSPEFLKKALFTALPGLEEQSAVKYYLSQLSEEVTIGEACAVFTAGINQFEMYEMSLPTLELREWSMENPIPFATVPVLPEGFLEEHKQITG